MPKGVYPRKPRKTSKATARRRRKTALPSVARAAVFDHKDGVWVEKKELTAAEVRRLRDKAAELANKEATDGARLVYGQSNAGALEYRGYDNQDMIRARTIMENITKRKPRGEPGTKDKELARALFELRQSGEKAAREDVARQYDRDFALSLVQAVNQGIISPKSRFIHMPMNELQAIVRVLERHGY